MSNHLTVICHGLWGQPTHLDNVKNALAARHPDMHILVSTTNAGNRTYDGVDVCGERVVREIRERIDALKAEGIEVNKISMVGYSLGGLIARYAIGVLYSSEFFKKVEPVNFTTFATPHVGVSATSGGILGWLFSSIGPKSLSITGAHIFLADSLIHKRPLLEVMSDHSGPFYRGLESFQKKVLYSNIVNDRSVPFFTAAIMDNDPFRDLSKIRLHHDATYKVLLDAFNPYTLLKDNEKIKPKKAPLNPRELLIRVIMIVGLPLWIMIYSANAVVANYKSSQRISLHRAETKNQKDDASSLFTSQEQQLHQQTTTQNAIEEVVDGQTAASEKDGLKLNKHQAQIVANLNKLQWEKYMVHIQKSNHSHAAIVSRIVDADRLSEGLVVIKHWLDKAFVL